MKEQYLTFHCSKRAGQRERSPGGAEVSSGARGGVRVRRAPGTVISCCTMPGWDVETGPITVEPRLAGLRKGRAHRTIEAWEKSHKITSERKSIRAITVPLCTPQLDKSTSSNSFHPRKVRFSVFQFGVWILISQEAIMASRDETFSLLVRPSTGADPTEILNPRNSGI